jgi:hypothetical protein
MFARSCGAAGSRREGEPHPDEDPSKVRRLDLASQLLDDGGETPKAPLAEGSEARPAGDEHNDDLRAIAKKQMEMIERQSRMFEQQQFMMFQMFEELRQSKAAAAPTALAVPFVPAAEVAAAPQPKAPSLGSVLAGSGSDAIIMDDLNRAACAVLPKELKATGEQTACVNGAAATLRKEFNLLLNSEEKISALKNRQELANKEKAVPGLKPYASPYRECPSADEVSPMAGTTITIVVDEGLSHSEVRELLHHRTVSLTASIDLAIEKHRHDGLVKQTSLATFLTEVKAKMSAHALCTKKYIECLEAPENLVLTDPDAGYTLAARTYQRVVKEMAEERVKRAKAKEKEEAKIAKAKEEVMNMSPEQVLEAKFKEIAKAAAKPSHSPTKNGQSPGAARGQNGKNGAKGGQKQKAKQGKGQPQPKGSGKGKSQPAKGKAKGKGKSSGGKGSAPGGKPFWQQKGKGKGKGSPPKSSWQ